MQIILREIRSFYRSIPQLLFACVFPLVMVFLLGTMLENIDVSEYAIGEINAGYVSNTKEAYSLGLDAFLQKAEAESGISFKKFASAKEAQKALDNEEICTLVEFLDEKAEISGGNDVTRNRAVKSIIDGYLTTVGAVNAVMLENPMRAADIGSVNKELVARKESMASRSMMDYYAVTMIIMMIFMGGITMTCGSIHDDRKNTTLRRIYGSPRNKTQVFLEIICGNIPYVLIQIVIVMAGSSLMFGAKYCSTLKGNLLLFLMLFSVSMAVIGFSALLGMFFTKGSPQIYAIAISWVMLFLSGSFAKGVEIKGFSEYLPTYIVQSAAFDLTVFGRTGQMWQVTAGGAVCFMVFLFIGTVMFHKGGNRI